MKNKPIQNHKKGQQKVLNASKPPMAVKNRDQLRKKLKSLLDKQGLSPPEKASQQISSKAKSSYNTEENKGSSREKSIILSQSPKNHHKDKNFNGIPQKQKVKINSKNPKTKKLCNFNSKNEGGNSKPTMKNKKFAISNEKPKSNDHSPKRDLNKKGEPLKKRSKTSEHTQTSNNSLKTEKQKQPVVSPKENVTKHVHSPKKKKKNKGEVKNTVGEPKLKDKLSKNKSKFALSQRPVKREQYAQGRGPLRPQTSESEFDAELDSSPRILKRKHKQTTLSESDIDASPKTKQTIPNTEQALMRAKNDFEGSGSDNNHNDTSYLDFLFDETYVDSEETTECSSDSQDEYTEEESEYEYSYEESDLEHASESCEDDSQEKYDEYSEDEYSDDYSSDLDEYFHSSDDDDSYEPPEDLLEDVYIAKGTAVKHELSTDDVGFDSDTQYAQIIEMPTKIPVQKRASPIKEPLPQSSIQNQINKTTCEDDEVSMVDSDDSCPELVPIENLHDNESFYPSSSESSHSCFSSCGCGSCDEIIDTANSEQQQYKPMTPEVIKAKAETVDGIETFFDTKSNDQHTKATPNCGLEEIRSSYINPLQSKVYTINNEIINVKRSQKAVDANSEPMEILNNDSFPSQPKTIYIHRSQILVHGNKGSNEILNNDSIQSQSNKILVDGNSDPNEISNIKSNPTTYLYAKKGVDENSKATYYLSTQNQHETPKKIINETVTTTMATPINLPLKERLPQKSFETIEESNPFNKQDKSNSIKSSQPKASIRTLFFNAINCNQVIVLLKDPLYIYGTVKLKLLAGHLEIFGYNPKRNEVLEIFSPRGYSSLKIEPSQSDGNVPLNENELLSLTPFFIRSDLEELLKKFNPTKDAIVVLERNDRSKKVNMLRKYMVEHLFPNMNSIQSDRPFYTSEFLLRCIITPHSDNALLINPDWNNIQVQSNSKIMIIGGKSVGKSTCGRYLINKNLNKYQKILYVDLDIGQPEMFVPQTVSATTLTAPLLGPGYFLNKQPDKSFLVGHISIIHSLETYIESLKALFKYCNANSEYKDIPWIVNTMGYNKGFGDELISVICSLLRPSNIVQFESDREINDFDIIMMKDNVKSIERNIVGDIFKASNEFDPQHQLTLMTSFIPRGRSTKNEMALKPRDTRLATILSKLSSTLTGHAEWMTDVKPLCSSIDDLNIIKMGDDQIDKEDLVKTLVGNLVYLCRMEPEKAHECFGIGIVRGVDYPLRQIYLLPAIPVDLLKNVNCLAICEIPLPSSILLNQGPKVKGTASYVYNTLDEAASMYIKQMYNKPQQFPTGKRK